MLRISNIAGLATAVMLGGALSASAALLDFTDSTVGLVGTIDGVGYTVTGVPVDPNTNDMADSCGAVCDPLALDNDGLGINDDEISSVAGLVQQYITITFADRVDLTGVYWLDMYNDNDDPLENEIGFVSVGGTPASPADVTTNAQFDFRKSAGFASTTGFELRGTSFSFFVGDGNDAVGRADAALAAINISAVPLPAGLLLMGTALGGLGLTRRRKNKKA